MKSIGSPDVAGRVGTSGLGGKGVYWYSAEEARARARGIAIGQNSQSKRR